ncbi:MAG: hypothetical protein BLM47_01030 [Candidatus Reconcilbacillus cellulovorans]|uniref:Serine/threonine protein kinase n=1 Tax=Candidatus Reconcilbacillus cellulovorans TaxID=1906605 RepID=A0A2A6E461_9BACL|nr:MAG: hypothetical protein BLM47_01030 [Candidatus Reconcilbacillus cellulovorans]
MAYRPYGLDAVWVERIKRKLADAGYRKRVLTVLRGVGKADLQDEKKVARLVKRLSRELNEPVPPGAEKRIVRFVIEQRIDPNDMWQLMKLWSMFR